MIYRIQLFVGCVFYIVPSAHLTSSLFTITYYLIEHPTGKKSVGCSILDKSHISSIKVIFPMTNDCFFNTLYALPPKIKEALLRLSPAVLQEICEIRLRKNLPLCITVKNETLFVTKNGQTTTSICETPIKVSEEEIKLCLKLLCNSSVFAHENELKNGFIIMKNGCRAGVCGRISNNNPMQDVTSINIRIAREVFGSSETILSRYQNGGLLIAGPPGSGKTTILRDMVRSLSNGINGKCSRVSVIDSRGEISGGGVLDLGINTDIILSENKALAAEIMVRTMFPEVLAFDEIGTQAELDAVSESFLTGVKLITTAHINNLYELKARNVTNKLLQSGAVNQVALLPQKIGERITVLNVKELYFETTA